jgi:hypothetical protein
VIEGLGSVLCMGEAGHQGEAVLAVSEPEPRIAASTQALAISTKEVPMVGPEGTKYRVFLRPPGTCIPSLAPKPAEVSDSLFFVGIAAVVVAVLLALALVARCSS